MTSKSWQVANHPEGQYGGMERVGRCDTILETGQFRAGVKGVRQTECPQELLLLAAPCARTKTQLRGP